MLKIKQKAPLFSLPDQNGEIHNLKDYLNKGKNILIYFYPKDDTSGCTKEACNFRDDKKALDKLGLTILGISKDGVKSHKKFSEKYELNFPILSDESTETIKAYGAWQKKKFMGREYMGTARMSFLLDEKGKIIKIYDSVDPENHSSQLKEDL